jgi:hypothetical protein
LVKEQYGFREKSSTQKATFNLFKEIINALNTKRIVGGVFCDLHKVFDCVNHDILLAKLEFYGVTGNFLNLIKSYLEYRYQRVKICSKLDQSMHILNGKELNMECLRDLFLDPYGF